MKYLYFGLILIFVSLCFSLYNANINKRQILIRDLKTKMEVASRSALSEIDYSSEDGMDGYSQGFGETSERPDRYKVDFDLAAEKFEKILFDNLSLSSQIDIIKMRNCILIEALIEDDRIIMRGKNNRKKIVDFNYKTEGLSETELLELKSRKVFDEIERFCADENGINGTYYPILNEEINLFRNTSFLAILDSVKIPYLTSNTIENKIKNYYVFSCGGADLSRK